MGDIGMFGYIRSLWQKIKKKYNKILPLFFSVFLLYFSSINVSALTPNFDQYFCLWAGNTTPYLELKSNDTLLGYGLSTFDSRNHNEQLVRFYTSSFNPTSNVTSVRIYKPSGCMDFLYVPEKYDYYLACRFYCSATVSQSTFVPSSMDLIFYNCLPNESQATFVPIDFNYYHYDVGDITGFQTVSKLPDNLIGQPAGFSMYGSPAKIHSNPTFQVFVIPVEKSTTNGADISAEILAELEKQTDIFFNGDSSTGGIVSGADSSKSELESIVNEYQQIENSMLDNFTLYQTDILTDLNSWSWGGLSLCANWVGDTMTSYFQNMGDFKQYIIYPLLLGIALFFIGRGSAIIGHLFRKPTETYTFSERSSSTKYVNGQRITTSVTKSNRNGGVLRK